MVTLLTCLGGRSSRTSPFLRLSCSSRCRASSFSTRPVALRSFATVVIDELQYRGQFFFVVFDGGAGQGPGANSSQPLQRVTCIVAVLDTLGFVRHYDVPGFSTHWGSRVVSEIRAQGVVADQGHVSVRLPLP